MPKQDSSSAVPIILVVVLLGLMLPCLAGAGVMAFWLLNVEMLPTPAEPPAVYTEPIANDATVATVCEITASLMGVDAARVQPSTSLADLGADELDIVELVMELEEEFDVSIPDQAITGVTGSEEWAVGSDKLTMRTLAEIVEGQKALASER